MPNKKIIEYVDDPKKRTRTLFTYEQQFKLEESFKQDHWPTTMKKEELASELGMSASSVRTWFQNRRARMKREEELRKAKLVLQKKWQTIEDKRQTRSSSSGKVSPKTPSGSRRLAMLANHAKQKTPKTSNARGGSLKAATRGKGKGTGKRSSVKSPMHSVGLRRIKPKPSSDAKAGNEVTKYPAIAAQLQANSGKTKAQSNTASDASLSTGTSAVADMMEKEEAFVSALAATSESELEHDVDKDVVQSIRQKAPLQSAGMKYTSGECSQSIRNMAGMNALLARYGPPVPPELFTVLIEMMAVEEGGIVDLHDPNNSRAVNNALYGISIADNSRIVYNKNSGFNIIDANY